MILGVIVERPGRVLCGDAIYMLTRISIGYYATIIRIHHIVAILERGDITINTGEHMQAMYV
jgi:hypothetical protein